LGSGHTAAAHFFGAGSGGHQKGQREKDCFSGKGKTHSYPHFHFPDPSPDSAKIHNRLLKAFIDWSLFLLK